MMWKRIGISLLIFVVGMASLRLVAQEVAPDPAEVLAERGVTVQTLENVTASAVQVLDVTSSSARLNFVGTVPLACTVVYGTTEAFGSAAVDTTMNGGALVEHNPVLRGLQPDTQYTYRLQGSGEDGTFYVSAIGTFRTPPASAEPSANLLAPGNGAQVVTVSSSYGGGADDSAWGILKAFDDDPNTEWSSDGDGDAASFAVRLGARSHITQVTLRSRQMSDGTARILSFTVTADDGATYGPFATPDAAQTYTFDVDFTATLLRFNVVTSSGGNTGLRDFAVFGQPAP